MIKTFIVEDKPPILRNIKQKIVSYSTELEVVGVAINGEQALPLIKELRPHIIFTDIRMPVMDGLKLIEEVKKINPEIHFVIISGYEDFAYSRQAMRLGVFDYLLKPVTQENIDEVLNKIIPKVYEHRQQEDQKFLYDILHSSSQLKNLHGYHLGCAGFITFLLCAGSFSNFAIDYSSPFNTFWSSTQMIPILSKYLSEHERYWLFEGKSMNEQILVLGLDLESTFNEPYFSESLLKDLHDFQIPITLLVGQRVENVLDIAFASQMNRALLQKNLIFGQSHIFYKRNLNINTQAENFILDVSLEKKLVALILSKQKAAFFKEIEQLIQSWKENQLTQSAIEKLLKQIIRLCRKAILNQEVAYSDKELEIDEVISISKNYTALGQGIKFIFEQYWRETGPVKHGKDSTMDVINHIEKYLLTHYAEQLTINDIAERANLDPAYLSRIFKQAKETSPMEYLTGLRIEKAKNLMRDEPHLMLKNIAEIVGYNDPYYFSRVFKTSTGLSPTEYKQLHP